MSHDVCTEIELDAPVDQVWALLEDVENYANWNSIFSFKRTNLKPGGRGILLAKVGAPFKVPLPVKFQVVEPNKELRWQGGFGPVVHGSHFLKLEELPNNRTKLTHGETFSGVVIDASWKAIAKGLPGAYKAFNKKLAQKLAS